MNSLSIFSDTEKAFKSLSDRDLDRSYWLFKLINNNFLVKFGQPLLKGALAIGLPVSGMIKSTIFKQFCGGESIRDCEKTIERLDRFHIKTILDYSGEGKEEESEFKATFEHVLSTIALARVDKRIAFCVFKVSGISRHEIMEKASLGTRMSESETKELQLVKSRIDAICQKCSEAGIPVFIDAEETWIQDAIDAIATAMMEKYNTKMVVVYNTLQMYRTDRLQHLKEAVLRAEEMKYFSGFKLVRGAYMEKERERALKNGKVSPIHVSKEATDKDFEAALDFCIPKYKSVAVCIGTHNENSTIHGVELMRKHNIPSDHEHIYFSQLLGMSDHISFNLSHEGYRVAKYVPFGPVKTVMPYLFRRAEENTAISGQMGRELNLIIQERKRRKSS